MEIRSLDEIAMETENLYTYFTYCIQTCGIPLQEIATKLDMSPTGLSKRMNLVPQENTPRFSISDIDLYMEKTGDLRPKDFLNKKFDRRKEDREKKILNDLRERVPDLEILVGILKGTHE